MAPIPEDNQNKPPNKDSEINNFSNPNLVTALDLTDSSGDSETDGEESGAPSGYSLLPQEPGDAGNDGDSDEESDDDNSPTLQPESESVAAIAGDADSVPEAVLTSEASAAAPTVSVSNVADSSHPAFLERFPDGKVPPVPKDKDQLWNSKRVDETRISLDSTQESKILKAMSGFSLPADSIPEWARHLPEDRWQQNILERIHGNKKHSTTAAPKSSSSPSQPVDSCSSQDGEPAKGGEEAWVAQFPDCTDSSK